MTFQLTLAEKEESTIVKALKIAALASTAALVFAVSAPALADSSLSTDQRISNTFNSHTNSTNANIEDNVARVGNGNIGMNAAAGVGNQQTNATVLRANSGDVGTAITHYQGQHINNTGSLNEGFGRANIRDDVGRNFTGNVGMNVAAGIFNEQGNLLSLTLRTADPVSTKQDQTQNGLKGRIRSSQTAKFRNNAFENATGNIGANVAAGIGNQQLNSLIVSRDSLGDQTTTVSQTSTGTNGNVQSSLRADFEDNAFRNARGNIGANLAAGFGNQQANSLTLVR